MLLENISVIKTLADSGRHSEIQKCYWQKKVSGQMLLAPFFHTYFVACCFSPDSEDDVAGSPDLLSFRLS